MLYMGMEHLRTNNIPLAGHFLKSSRSMEKNDPLCCNELGVWAYRSREWKDGIRWFILALRLYVESVVSEKSALSWNEEDSKQDVSSKVNRPRFEFGQVLLSRIMIASNSVPLSGISPVSMGCSHERTAESVSAVMFATQPIHPLSLSVQALGNHHS